MKYINPFVEHLLVSLRYRLSFIFGTEKMEHFKYVDNAYECNKDILAGLKSGKPFMVSRFGLTELRLVINYIWVSRNPHSAIGFITGKHEKWWWNKDNVEAIKTLSGFFPLTEENLVKFSQLVIEDSRQIDILGTHLV